MSGTSIYITSQGEAWDQAAKRIWGFESLTHELLAANPQYRALILFPAGLKLTVPEIEIPTNEEPPPWKSL